MRGHGVPSFNLRSVSTINGLELYQLRALLFVRSQVTSLCVPALPDTEQKSHVVNIPSLERLFSCCRFAEQPDFIGAW